MIDTLESDEGTRLPAEFLNRNFNWNRDSDISKELGMHSQFLRNFRCTHKETLQNIIKMYPRYDLYQAILSYKAQCAERTYLLEKIQAFIEVELDLRCTLILKKRTLYPEYTKIYVNILQYWCGRADGPGIFSWQYYWIIPTLVKELTRVANDHNLFEDYPEFKKELEEFLEVEMPHAIEYISGEEVSCVL